MISSGFFKDHLSISLSILLLIIPLKCSILSTLFNNLPIIVRDRKSMRLKAKRSYFDYVQKMMSRQRFKVTLQIAPLHLRSTLSSLLHQ